jgi:hypothetical protein
MRELIRLMKHSLLGILVLVKVRDSNNKYMPGRHCFAHMVNFRVIQVKVVAPEKLLDVNIFSKNTLIPIVLFTLFQNNLCLDMASCDIQNYCMLIYAIGQNQLNVDLDLKPMPLSLFPHLRSLPLSTIHNISFSLSVLSA